MAGNPSAVRVGPGWLYIAPLATTEPDGLDDLWTSWVQMGYTDEGSEFVFDQTFEDVTVAEEYDPIDTLQTARAITVNFALAEMTATNLEIAFNGGTVIGPLNGLTTFEPPAAGDFTPCMLGWEATDNFERWIFRRCTQIGSVNVGRRKAPQKATLPMSFRATKPANDQAFKAIFEADYDAATASS